jgi:two-component system response regulator HydG
VVDDEPAVRKIVGQMLRSFGVDVVEAEDGEEALLKIAEAPHSFTLVLLDVTMPRLDGMQTLPRIRAIDPALPVVLMSGYAKNDTEFRRMKPSLLRTVL